MDVLLSLPIVSYLLGPGATTSWSTSVNVLFFYLTWTTLVLSYAPLHIALAGVLTLRVLLWMIPSLLFLAFDTSLPSLAASTKLGGAASLPPRGTADARLRLGKLVLLAVINLVLEALLQAALQALLPMASAGASTAWSSGWTALSALVVKPKPKSFFFLSSLRSVPLLLSLSSLSSSHKPVNTAGLFRTSSSLPLPWLVLRQTVLLFFLREALVYYGHRYLLSRPASPSRIVRRLSRWHLGSFAHTRRQAPFSLLVFADHPASVLVLRWLPLYLPAALIKPHVLVFFCFAGLVTFEETMGMSGYRAVPGLLLRGIARRTAAHYNPAIIPGELPAQTPRSSRRRTRKQRTGGQATVGEEAPAVDEGGGGGVNFGAWGLLDWVQGTSWPRSGSLVADAQATAAAVSGLGQLQGAAATVSQAMRGDDNDDNDDKDEDYDDEDENEEVIVEKKTRARPHQNGRRKKRA
ncbi:hypothetical protein SCUCBS95973_008782 [Sporothrix curviconia]|uniref:Fatty acid hydroxylase domain-containing protein n=1 Tax=Sporothrix curviconia TaxID=1260050 RepID=A0ABP0CS12_9PEZI